MPDDTGKENMSVELPKNNKSGGNKETPLLPESVNRPDVPGGSTVPERYFGLSRDQWIEDIIPDTVREKREAEIQENAIKSLRETQKEEITKKRKKIREEVFKKIETQPEEKTSEITKEELLKEEKKEKEFPSAKEIGDAVADALSKKEKVDNATLTDKLKKETERQAVTSAVSGVGKAAGFVATEVVSEIVADRVVEGKPGILQRVKRIFVRGEKKKEEAKKKEEKVEPEEERKEEKTPQKETESTILPAATLEDKEELKTKEKAVEELSFDELLEKAIGGEGTEKLSSYQAEIDKRAKEAEARQYFDRQYLKNRIIATTRESSWDTYYDNLVKLSQDAENESRGHSGYRSSPRYENLVGTAVLLAARQTKDEGITRRVKDFKNKGKSEDEINDYLNKKFDSPSGRERYENNRRVLDRVHVINFQAMDLAEIVGSEETRKREKAEEDKRRLQELMPSEVEKIKQYPGLDKIFKDLPSAIAEKVGAVFAQVMELDKITAEDFLEVEKWADHPYEFSPDRAPLFYKRMTKEEKEIFQGRVDLEYAVYVKRSGKGGLSIKNVGENVYIDTISNMRMQTFTKIPGVKEALAEYLKAIDNPKDPQTLNISTLREDEDNPGKMATVNISIGECKTQSEAEEYRFAMKERIKERISQKESEKIRRDLEAGLVVLQKSEGNEFINSEELMNSSEFENNIEKEIDTRAVMAEQIAFNLHFLANTFESRQGGWNEDYTQRERPPKLMLNQFSQQPLSEEMTPLDTLISVIFKERKERTIAGKLSEWAAYQTQISASEYGEVDNEDISRVVVIKDEKNEQEMKKCWTLQRDYSDYSKFILYVPECYPVKTLKSYFEEVDDNKGGVPVERGRGRFEKMKLVDAIKNEEDIDWKNNQFTWLDYRLHAKKEAIIFALEVLGEDQKEEELNKALARRKDRANWSTIRWMIHSREGLDKGSRLPRILIKRKEDLEDLINLYCTSKEMPNGLITRSEILFPWEDIRYGRNDRKFET